MLTNILKDLIPHYEQTLRNIANHHKFALKDIHNEYERIKAETKAENFEDSEDKEQKVDAISLRISEAIFYLKRNLYEDAAYQVSKAGRNAFLVHKTLLYAQLRHIGGLQFRHIIVTKELSPTSNPEYYHRLYKEMCYSFLYAAEAYTKEKRYKVGIRCWNNFKQMALTSGFGNKELIGTLGRVKENCLKLKTSVDDYCRQANITVPD